MLAPESPGLAPSVPAVAGLAKEPEPVLAQGPVSTEPERAFPAVVQARALGPVRAPRARAADQEPEARAAAVPVVQVPEQAAERALAQGPVQGWVRVPALAQLVVALAPELERDPEPQPEVRYC